MGKGSNGRIHVVHALHDAAGGEVKDFLPGYRAVCPGKYQFSCSGTGDGHFHIAVHIAVSVTGNGDGLFPCADGRMHTLHQNGCTEHGAIQHGTDGTVRAFPHFMQMILFYSLGIGGNGGTLDSHTVLLGCQGTVDGHLIPGFVPVLQPQVIILGFQIYKGLNQQFLNIRPEDSGHFVSIHLHQRGFHLNLCHCFTRMIISKTKSYIPFIMIAFTLQAYRKQRPPARNLIHYITLFQPAQGWYSVLMP